MMWRFVTSNSNPLDEDDADDEEEDGADDEDKQGGGRWCNDLEPQAQTRFMMRMIQMMKTRMVQMMRIRRRKMM